MRVRRNKRSIRLAVYLVVSCLGFAICASAELTDVEIEQLFVNAGQAYDSEQLDEAAQLYTQLLDAGYVAPELLFNLGNAHYRAGQLGEAVRRYRQATYLVPRDPDVRANLRFALDNHGALSPTRGALRTLLQKLNLSEWVTVAVLAYWLAAATFCIWLLNTRGRVIVLRCLWVSLCALAIAFAGVLLWFGLHHSPEGVVTQRNQQALFAPIAGSTAHFTLPEGSIVRLGEISGEWVKVSINKKSGWVRKNACAPVYPWQSPR